MSNPLRERLRDHVAQARAIKDRFDGKEMPVEAARQMEQHLDAANGLTARLALLGEKQDLDGETWSVSLADPTGSGGSPQTHGRKWDRPIAAETKMRDLTGTSKVSDEAIYGWLGHHVKSQVVPSDPAEQARWDRAIGAKDMVTTSVAAGGALVPTAIAAFIIDLARAQTVTMNLGARVVPMSTKVVQVPRVEGDVTAAWLAEAAAVTPSDATLGQVGLTAKRMEIGPVKISHELNEDSDPTSIGEVVTNSIAKAAALKLDQAALLGTGSGAEPTGIRNAAGVSLFAPGANGDAMTYDLLLALARLVAAGNFAVTGFAMTPGAQITLSGLKDGQQAYLAPPAALREVPQQVTTSIPANLTKGTGTALTQVYAGMWSELLIGLRAALSVQILTELYRATGEIGLIGRLRADVALAHANAFAVATHVDD